MKKISPQRYYVEQDTQFAYEPGQERYHVFDRGTHDDDGKPACVFAFAAHYDARVYAGQLNGEPPAYFERLKQWQEATTLAHMVQQEEEEEQWWDEKEPLSCKKNF